MNLKKHHIYRVLTTTMLVSSISLSMSCTQRPEPMKEATKKTVAQIENRDVNKDAVKGDWIYMEPVVHTYRHKLREIDDFIRDSKEDYFNICLDWVRNSGIPENDCSYNLLDRVERRYGLTDDPNKILKMADEAFFSDLKPKLYAMIDENFDLDVRIEKTLESREKMFSYYKQVYSFTKISTELETKIKLELKKPKRKQVDDDNEYSK